MNDTSVTTPSILLLNLSYMRSLGGKKIALFGSYGWGSGEWMEQWAARCKEDGAVLYDESGLIVNEAPDDEALGRCRDLGRALAAW